MNTLGYNARAFIMLAKWQYMRHLVGRGIIGGPQDGGER